MPDERLRRDQLTEQLARAATENDHPRKAALQLELAKLLDKTAERQLAQSYYRGAAASHNAAGKHTAAYEALLSGGRSCVSRNEFTDAILFFRDAFQQAKTRKIPNKAFVLLEGAHAASRLLKKASELMSEFIPTSTFAQKPWFLGKTGGSPALARTA